jgi:hypothetical protein
MLDIRLSEAIRERTQSSLAPTAWRAVRPGAPRAAYRGAKASETARCYTAEGGRRAAKAAIDEPEERLDGAVA